MITIQKEVIDNAVDEVSVCEVAFVCSADSPTPSSDIPPDSSELFTVPGLSEAAKGGERVR